MLAASKKTACDVNMIAEDINYRPSPLLGKSGLLLNDFLTFPRERLGVGKAPRSTEHRAVRKRFWFPNSNVPGTVVRRLFFSSS